MTKWRFAYFIIPLFTMLVGNTAIYIFASKIENHEIEIVVGAFLGIALFFALLKIVRWLATKAGVSKPNLGNLKSFGIGLSIGLLAIILSGFLYAKHNDKEVDWSELKKETSSSLFTAITPATNEEATFRFGWVHGATSLGGTWIGCAVGSVPFGLLHLIDKLRGKEVSMERVLGLTLFGLLLSILFLHYDLWAAVAFHWIWNVFSDHLVKSMSLGATSESPDFEGSLTTSAVLLVLILALILINLSRQRRLHIFGSKS